MLKGFGAPTLVLALVLAIAACGSPTEQAKECTGGGSADEATFAQYFSQMQFDSGGPPMGEGGQEFTASEAVVVMVTATGATATRFCVQERGRLSTVVYDKGHALAAGESRVDLGAFSKKADYVIRVSVEEILVKSLTFTVR